jgi:hypothetical protein
MIDELLPSLEERNAAHGDYIHDELILRVSFGITYYRKPRGGESFMCLLKVGDLWLVTYYIEGQEELHEHFKTRESALTEMDRIMAIEKHYERTVCHCGNCHAVFECKMVGRVCPMCGWDHNRKDDPYLGWSIWDLPPEWFAVQMADSWKEHVEWRRENGLLPEEYMEEKYGLPRA